MTGANEIHGAPPVLEDVVDAVSTGAIPVLRDAVEAAPRRLAEDDIAALQAELVAMTRTLAEQLLNGALRDMEAALFEQLDNRLREELPGLIDKVLQEHLDAEDP